MTGLCAPAAAGAHALRQYSNVTTSPDGRFVASIEADEPARDGDEDVETLVVRSLPGGQTTEINLPCTGSGCRPSDPAFSRDGKTLSFVLKLPGDPRPRLETVHPDGTGLVQRLAFEGTLGGLRYGPDGRLALLAVANAHKQIGAVQPGAPLVGEIGVDQDEQRIALVNGDKLDFVSPPHLFVYEFDWRPDGQGFVGTASPGNGDDGWWTAKLWAFPEHGSAQILYTPPPKQQLASPLVSPDGRRVAFIGGIMSDFGSTGGDAYSLALDHASTPVDLTAGLKATVTGLAWNCPGGGLQAMALRGPDAQWLALGQTRPDILWSGEETVQTSSWSRSLSCGDGIAAAIHQSFTAPPAIQTAGADHLWRTLTHQNDGMTAPVQARSLTWKSDTYDIQGWLLTPTDRTDNDNQRLITLVHGGPSAASTPFFPTDQRDLWLLQAGYDLFLPNPRGSFGQGEAFTLANVRDFGHGDLRDILRGVDAAMAVAPISPEGLGLMGYSYGGYMTMWAVTQTNRFKAAVAGAGVSDWRSYYGENGIDQWMIPFFGASVYADPEIYARSSPIVFITHVHTPTFEFVGDRDVECPMPQTEEFWHALHAFGVPTEFVVYPGQGHDLHDAADRADAKRRTLAWFARYLGTSGAGIVSGSQDGASRRAP